MLDSWQEGCKHTYSRQELFQKKNLLESDTCLECALFKQEIFGIMLLAKSRGRIKHIDCGQVHSEHWGLQSAEYDPRLGELCSNKILIGFNLMFFFGNTSVTDTLISWKHGPMQHQNNKLEFVWAGVMLVDPVHGAAAPCRAIQLAHIVVIQNLELPLKSVKTSGKPNEWQFACSQRTWH